MLLTFAFSARDFIKDVGSYAGFASVIALALFALLLFAQAREIKRLREWGSQAHDRIGELERGVAAALDMARRAASRAAAPAPAPAQPARGPVSRRPVGPAAVAGAAAAAGAAPRVASTSAPVRPQLLPAAPSGLAGPALASATVLIPLPGAPSSTAQSPVPLRAATPAGRPAAAAAGAGATTAAAAIDQRERVAPDNGSNGYHDDPPTEFPPPSRRPTPPDAARPAAGGPPRRGAPAPGARPRPAGRPAAPARAGAGGARGNGQEPEEGQHGRRRFRAVLLVLLALVVVGGAAYALLLRGDDEPSTTVQTQAPSGRGRTRRAAARRTATTRAATPAPPHGDTSVVVLNGAGVDGLASRVMDELTAAGYPAGVVGDASSANRGSTAISFRGAGAEAAAREVARTLRISTDAVTEIDTDTETQACILQDPCTAQVVVTVGADRSQP